MNAQEVLVEESPDEYEFYKEEVPHFGPNGKFFMSMYVAERFYIPAFETSQIGIQYLRSNDFELGGNFKYRLTNWLATGAQLYYNFSNYPTTNELILADISYSSYFSKIKSAKYVINNLGLAPYLRINIGKRGNTVGNYIDFVGWGEINTTRRAVLKVYTLGDNLQKIVLNPSYINLYNYGVSLRLGVKWFAIEAKYRLSDITQFTGTTVFPRFSVGFQLSTAK